MSLTVQDVLDALEGADPGDEVLVARWQQWTPQQHTVSRVLRWDQIPPPGPVGDWARDEHDPDPDDPGPDDQPIEGVVYLEVTGVPDNPYVPQSVREALGW